jgi:ribosomal 30S subunit maturation factor RimM
VLVVTRPQGGDLLLPAIASVVREVDVAAGRVVVAPQEEL